MWLHQKIKGKYNEYQTNVPRKWVKWPMWIASTNYKGFQGTQSVIAFSTEPSEELLKLWSAATFSIPITSSSTNIAGNNWYSCDFDQYGYSYFCGVHGVIKRDIMNSKQIWGSQSSAGNTDYIVRTNGDFVYVGGEHSTAKLRKLDLDGNLIWKISATASRINGIEFDDSGNVYVCGYTTLPGTPGFVAKYNSSGVEQWATTTIQTCYDIKFYGSNLYVASDYGGLFPWPTNGAIYIFDTSGNGIWNFGEELYVRDTTGAYYESIEVDANYVYVVSNEGSTQGLDIYMRNNYSLTFSTYTSAILGGNNRAQDLELNESGNLMIAEYASQRIYQMSSTFSSMFNWQVGSADSPAGLRGIRFKKTY